MEVTEAERAEIEPRAPDDERRAIEAVIEQLAERVRRLEKVLRAARFAAVVDGYAACIGCGAAKDASCAPQCEADALLREAAS